MIPDPTSNSTSDLVGEGRPVNVVPFPPQPPPPVQTPPWPGSGLDVGQLAANALAALWWGYGWSPAIEVGAVVSPAATRRAGWMGFDPTRRYPRWGIPDAILGLLAFFLGGVLFILPAAFATRDEGILNILGLVGMWVGGVAYLVFVSRLKGQGTLALDFGFRFKWIDLPIGLGLAFATMIASLIVRAVVANLFSADMTSNSEEIFSGQNNRVGVVVLAVMAAVGAPFVEELLFRGLIFRAFSKRLGVVLGVIISAAVFGLLHWQPADNLGSSLSLVAGIATYGVTFAVVDRWVGRIAPSIYAHMLLNSFAASVTVYEFFTGSKIS
jgi:membrane protease YdiL (CAAX protease family)